MSRHDLVSAQTSNVCMADVTSSNFLGRLVQCEQKGWGRGRWVGIYTQRVKTACGFGCKSPHALMVLKNSHLTSQGLHAVFKCDLARAG